MPKNQHVLSVINLRYLLHCYYCPAPFPEDTPAADASRVKLLQKGLITGPNHDLIYKVTDKGHAHVEQILSLELPKEAWLGANGQIIEI